MKRYLYIFFVFTLALSLSACNTNNTDNEVQINEQTVENRNHELIEVYYFHYTRRCITCNAIEEITKNCLNNFFAEDMKAGKLVFTSINLDEENSNAIAEELQVSTQSLLLVRGGKKTDLTNEAFMNAKDHPEELKSKIKDAIMGIKQ